VLVQCHHSSLVAYKVVRNVRLRTAMDARLADIIAALRPQLSAKDAKIIDGALAVRDDFITGAGQNKNRWIERATLHREFAQYLYDDVLLTWEGVFSKENPQLHHLNFVTVSDPAEIINMNVNLYGNKLFIVDGVVAIARALVIRLIVDNPELSKTVYRKENYPALIAVSLDNVNLGIMMNAFIWTFVLRAFMNYRKYRMSNEVVDGLGTSWRVELAKPVLKQALSLEAQRQLLWNEFINWKPPQKRAAKNDDDTYDELVEAIQGKKSREYNAPSFIDMLLAKADST
jgi:hypothetical protein